MEVYQHYFFFYQYTQVFKTFVNCLLVNIMENYLVVGFYSTRGPPPVNSTSAWARVRLEKGGGVLSTGQNKKWVFITAHTCTGHICESPPPPGPLLACQWWVSVQNQICYIPIHCRVHGYGLFKTVSFILIVRTHSNEIFHTFYGIGTMLEGSPQVIWGGGGNMGYYYISPDMYSTYSCPVLDVLLFCY